MTTAVKSKSAEIRDRLGHPVIDSDAHTLEVALLFQDYLKSIGAGRALESYQTAMFDSFVDPRWVRRTDSCCCGGGENAGAP